MSDAADLRARDAARVWHPYTPHGVDLEPLEVVGAHGSRLVLADGTELIDAIASWWACLHGHAHPRLIEAMATQARLLDHVLFAGATHEPAVRLAEELIALAPRSDDPAAPRLTRAFFSDDGSTAVEVALKIAAGAWVHRGETRRTVFLALEGGYHGDTFGAMSVGDPAPFFEPFAPLLFRARRVAPDAAALEAAFEEEGERVAGLILEPLVQGAAGMRFQPPAFLRDARALCTRHGVPLIADEVFTGLGRTGRVFACDHADVVPDLLCVAKALTGGLFPLAATLATEPLFEAFLAPDRSRFLPHGHTLTANPIGCAVALASLALLREGDLPARLDALGHSLLSSLSDLREHPHVRDLRQLGGILAFDLHPPSAAGGGYHSPLQPWIRKRALDLGVLLRPLGNVLYATPPTSLTPDELESIAHALRTLVFELPRS